MTLYWIAPEWIERLAGSLLHFVWQGALVAFLTAVVLRLLARRTAAARYAVSVSALGVMLLGPVLTFIFHRETGGAALALLQFLDRSVAEAGSAASHENIVEWTEWVVLAWVIGVALCGGRLIVGSLLSFRLVRRAQAVVSPEITRLAEQARATLLGARRVQLRVSAAVDTPAVFGWLRPVVLLPITATTGLTEGHLIAILAHELAHVRRHDFLVNAVQRGVEAALFYHPAVWWLSSRIRAEREHCCDDLAIQACGDRFLYAEALIELERARATAPALAIPAAGGPLGSRVSRVLGIQSVNRDWQPAAAALALVALCVLAGTWQMETIAAPAIAIEPLSPPPVERIGTLSPPEPERAATPTAESALGALTAIVTAQTAQPAGQVSPWVTTWSHRMELTEGSYNDETVRMFIRVTVGGQQVRLRLSNVSLGRFPLFLGEVHVALHDRGSEILPGTDRRLTFAGRTSVEIPGGETVFSDPVGLNVPAQAELAISIYAPNQTGTLSGWDNAVTGYFVSGNHTGAAGFTGAKLNSRLAWVSGIEVSGTPGATAAVVLVRNLGWIDDFRQRLNSANSTRNVALIDLTQAARGELDRPSSFPLLQAASYQAEFEKLITSQAGVRWAIICPDFDSFRLMIVDPPDAVREGRAVTGLVPERAIETLKRITDLARARGIRTIGCTLGPLQSVTSKEEDSFVYTTGRAKLPLDPARAAINEWIRSSGAFDSVADFDAVLRDPARPSRVKEELSLYDYSNSSFSGQPVPGMRQRLNKAMADAIDLSFFAR